MLFPSVNRQKSWLVFLCVVLGLLNIYFHFNFQGSISERGRWVDDGFSVVLAPFRSVLFHSKTWVSDTSSYLTRLSDADAENQRLKAELADAALRLQKFSELEGENKRLSGLLEFKQASPHRLLAARIQSRDLSLYLRNVTIDRGVANGVRSGMAVVSQEGAVGQIIRALDETSVVQLLTDVNSRLDGLVERSRTQVIVGGSLQGDMKLNFLPRRADIRHGDVLFSAGTGGIFPKGFKIGTIVGHAQDPNSILEEAEVEPAVNFGALEEVFVVLGANQ